MSLEEQSMFPRKKRTPDRELEIHHGISIRTYAAIQIMAAFVTKGECKCSCEHEEWRDDTLGVLTHDDSAVQSYPLHLQKNAEDAVRISDALLAELERPKP